MPLAQQKNTTISSDTEASRDSHASQITAMFLQIFPQYRDSHARRLVPRPPPKKENEKDILKTAK
jgi:hypothetical protein